MEIGVSSRYRYDIQMNENDRNGVIEYKSGLQVIEVMPNYSAIFYMEDLGLF
jgi:uncharacterized integral membrane protein